MAEKKPEQKPDAASAAAPAKKKLPIKTLIVVLGLMAAEAAGVVFILGLTGPADTEAATDKHALVTDESEQTQEVLVVEEKFQNFQTGKAWMWDAAIYVQVKNKNAEAVKKILERRNVEIKESISQIFSRAQHAQLKEPERQTLNRQLAMLFNDIFKTADTTSLVEKVLIARCRGFPADI